MDIAHIRALYDREQRQNLAIPGMRREVVGTLVRHVNQAPGDGMVIYSCLEPEAVESTVSEQIAYFEELGQGFEWKVYSHDPPPDLKDRLGARGFEVGEDEAILVLDLEAAPAVLVEPVTADIRRITDPEQIPSIITVQNEVWQMDFSWLGQRLTTNLRERPDFLSIYAAYADDQPVAAAWINFPPKNQFASLWGGSTLAGYRRRGLYTALLAVRVQEALQRGVRFLTVDASQMSRPILQKLGFQLIAYAYACNWKVETEEPRT
ncbi:MAG TPA: GNAT family N-acetyltransferase [Herpetosiphonaceae bacterium]